MMRRDNRPLPVVDTLEHMRTYTVRFGRPNDFSNPDGPTFSDWERRQLHVQRNEFNRVTVISVARDDLSKYPTWAEYSPTDYQGSGLFLCEDYYLEIKELSPQCQ